MQLRTHSLRTANTFDGLANLYEQLHQFRDPSLPGARSLSRHAKRYVTLRWLDDAHTKIACCYHNTDVVVWERRQDADYVTVTGWTSMSTETFADAYTPWNLRFKLALDEGFYVRVAMNRSAVRWHNDNMKPEDARCYEFSHAITFKHDNALDVFMPAEGTTKTSFLDVHSPMMRLALKRTNYHDFMAYARARLALHQGPIITSMCQGQLSVHTEYTTLGLLADPNKWDELLFSISFASVRTVCSTTAWLDYMSDHLRQCIYKEHKAVPVNQVEWYPWGQFEVQRKLRAKYSWAVY